MAYISESHARHIGHTRPSRRSFDGTESGSQGKQHEKHRHRRRKARMAEEDSGTIYVYRYASDGQDRNDGKRSDGTTEQRDPPSVASAPTYSRNNLVDSESGRSRRQDSVRRRRTSVNEEKPKRAIHREEDIVIDKRHGSLSTRKTVRELDHERAAVNRSSSMRERPSPAAVPPLQRRSTTIRTKTEPLRSQPATASIRSKREKPPTSTTETGRGSRVVFSLFGIPSVAPPEQTVQCLTCLSDDIPSSKSAKLYCGHNMCHDCLKRIFTMSVTDPQHMPPRCCTTEHIPLKHVERLFDTKFKMKWNKKYQEYTTKNRIYCPAKGCGEWIKPANIHTDLSSGIHPKKYGKCGRCRLKVCCKCNGKWHPGRSCSKDEDTKKFAEIAKREGWQRCFNCSAMVELKEGCNHMTCRCTAEFCMICGLKWKTCDCPWFNYEAVETDRLNHMNIPQPRRVPEEMGRNVPRAYHEELNRRHEEDRRDEALHHLQALGLDDRYGAPNVDDYLVGGPRDILGIGNAAGHFLNEDFVRRATHALGRDAGSADNVAQWLVDEHRTNLAAAEPPPERQRQQPSHTVRARLGGGARTLPPLRHHSVASRLYNNDPHTRASERVVPRRVRTDYAIEAARHRPNVEDELREMHDQDHGRRHSAMAGLTANTQEGRIGAWLEYVEEEDLDAEAGMPVQ